MGNPKIALIERKAFISNIQKYNMFDGPGIRTIVFFKGCPLRCKWCANPEGLERKYQVMFKKSACKDCGACVPVCPVGIHQISNETFKHEVIRSIDCTGCKKCTEVCHEQALSIVGGTKTISELYEIVEEDRIFYDMSGGGITLGGGEVLMQPEAAANLLMVCKKEGINTAIETSGYAKLEAVLKVAEFTDLFLYDIKHIQSERHFELTGVRNELILNNLKELLSRRYNVKIRMPLLKGLNDSQEAIEGVTQFLLPYKDYKNFKGVDLLPYHKFGVNKYNQLGMEYPITGDPSLNSDEMKRIESWFKQHDIPVTVINH
ncbi:choline TMA-lyase-activating enzyme [Neobacillus sp. FSL H8-0543]|uniref:choline TMA-lyase-activating enzyme n=1 Tax=Neobacillus sp. FSL H8-0543 TaxID=2954672 RepID=UPI0031580BB8